MDLNSKKKYRGFSFSRRSLEGLLSIEDMFGVVCLEDDLFSIEDLNS